MPKVRHRHLLNDPDIHRWYSNLARGSIVTAEERLRRLGRFCLATGYTPKSLIEAKQGDPKGFEDFIMDYVDKSLAKGEKPHQVSNNLDTLKSWLRHFGLEIEKQIRLPASDDVDEIVPTKEQLSIVLRHADARTRVTTSLMAFSGLRPESIGNFLGSDGLRLDDLPELTMKKREAVIQKTPMIVKVRKTLSKSRHAYFSFLPQEGCQYLREYLELRLRRGEPLSSQSPVVGHERPSRLPFIRTTKASWGVKLAIRSAGFDWRPYVLRSYADTAFDIAEARGLVSHPWRQFFMGHKGDIEARYSTNKGRLPPVMLEEMRSAYRRCEPLLSTLTPAIEEMSVVKKAKIEALQTIGEQLFGLKGLEIKVQKERELGRPLTDDEQLQLLSDEIKKVRETEKDPQMVVKEEELEPYLKDGWQFVSVLPSQKILIRK